MSERLGQGDARTDRIAPAFAHASEAELARILDFYEVRWEYEPHLYPILFSQEGAVLESFAPDFYLPDLDLYVELTTLRQRLVRKKNRKLRRLRELYPDLRIKLFYARDFRALMLKYGKLAIVGELSGTVGQVAQPHGEPVAGAVEAPAPEGPPRGRGSASAPPPVADTAADTAARRPTRLDVVPLASASDPVAPPIQVAAVSPPSAPPARPIRSRRKREAPAR